MINFRVEVQTAGKPQRLAPEPTPVGEVLLEAASDNSGVICVGGSNVQALLTGYNSPELGATDNLTLHNVDLYEWWVDARNANDAVVGLVVRP